MRLYNTANVGGVTAAAGVCAALAPTGPIGRALAGGGCAAAAYFILSYGRPGPDECLRAYLRIVVPPASPLAFRMVNC